ncbi:hypothetical protein ILUMI_21765 [Ignelater luminosus]|uniref:HTH psq-type domain-containing protein n=1 Tax=Ignelater luminosus TaxID=2038154 RepID=A0A8K0G380_IGNLU|nr:hypothetical protein ILUMI_21765 [Ignelater luminosus]
MGWLLASKRFNVPQATLSHHYQHVPVSIGRYKPTFDPEMKKELANHIFDFEGRLFGLNIFAVRKLACGIGSDKTIIKLTFRERNPSISLRAPEPTSAAKALLLKTVTDEKIPAHIIYNMNESGLRTVQKPPKVFARKGKKKFDD